MIMATLEVVNDPFFLYGTLPASLTPGNLPSTLPQLTHSSYYIRVVNSQLYSSQYHGKGNNEI